MKKLFKIILYKMPWFFAGAGAGQGINLIQAGNVSLGIMVLSMASLVTIALFSNMVLTVNKANKK